MQDQPPETITDVHHLTDLHPEAMAESTAIDVHLIPDQPPETTEVPAIIEEPVLHQDLTDLPHQVTEEVVLSECQDHHTLEVTPVVPDVLHSLAVEEDIQEAVVQEEEDKLCQIILKQVLSC